ncbi:MAG: hypothetical protein ACTHYD_07730 [Canibacter sp.]
MRNQGLRDEIVSTLQILYDNGTSQEIFDRYGAGDGLIDPVVNAGD